jgi:hypothetical protein
MQSSLPAGSADQNIKAVDLAEFAEIAKIVEITTPRFVRHHVATVRQNWSNNSAQKWNVHCRRMNTS